jgi:RimJ/RimL family protein N-acetyltransferase
MILKPLSEKDLEWLRMLRNISRKWFFDSSIISIKAQIDWFHNLPSTISPYVIWHKRERIGFFSIRAFGANSYEIGNLMIDPKFRGKSFMTKALDLYLDREAPLAADFVAFVKPDNIGSKRTFEKLGFSQRQLNDSTVFFWL